MGVPRQTCLPAYFHRRKVLLAVSVRPPASVEKTLRNKSQRRGWCSLERRLLQMRSVASYITLADRQPSAKSQIFDRVAGFFLTSLCPRMRYTNFYLFSPILSAHNSIVFPVFSDWLRPAGVSRFRPARIESREI